ncbi:MAG: D-hexose-6-phosphate mutarotase [Pseudomonadales bacterium]|nr:D-hexose-6-phosphate mutarotase [Pseudomonadales bacterium]
MNITSLNEQFGHPEYLVFETDNHGQARVRLSTARSNLTLYLQGAQITSCFLPAASEPQYPVADDLFWVSKSSVYTKGKSIRGGIPICWPWFGPHERPQDRPQHGFARTSEFMVTSASVGNERSQITLKMTRALPTFPEWQLADAPGVDCEVRITLSEQLRMILTTTNHLAHNIEVGSALHSYFLVSDVSQIQVPELQGIEYLDKLQAYKVLVQDQPLQVDREVDRVFRHPPACISLIDPGLGRTIRIETTGTRNLVVWNPWTETARAMRDLDDDGYPHMICLEPANALDQVQSLMPGEQHQLSQTISLTQ